MLLKIGTKSKPAIPAKRIPRLKLLLTPLGKLVVCCTEEIVEDLNFLSCFSAIYAGIMRDTKQGMMRNPMILGVVTLPRIHSIIVVISPIGDHAPPLFAAIMITPAKNHRSLAFDMMRRNIITIIMVVVILSSTADIKNVIMASIHKSLFLLWVVICSVMMWKPP